MLISRATSPPPGSWLTGGTRSNSTTTLGFKSKCVAMGWSRGKIQENLPRFHRPQPCFSFLNEKQGCGRWKRGKFSWIFPRLHPIATHLLLKPRVVVELLRVPPVSHDPGGGEVAREISIEFGHCGHDPLQEHQGCKTDQQ